MSASLSIRAVDKIYHPRGRLPVHAVKALTMDVGRGEIVALLGSSGCGKTSTLRMIAGFEEVSAGSIALADRRVERLAPAARNVAMAFEGYSLYPPLTVRENIAFALKRGRLSGREVRGGYGRWRRWSKSNRSSIVIQTRFREASSSVPRWRGPWCVTPISMLWTNRWGNSSRNCAPCCGAG